MGSRIGNTTAPAVLRGQRVDKAWGTEEFHMTERHSAADLD